MKLFWITPECPYPPDTGGRVAMWKRIYYLSKTNEIYLFSIVDTEEEFIYKKDLIEVCSDVNLYERNRGILSLIKCVVWPYPAVSRWNGKMSEDIDYIYSQVNPDFVIVDYPQMMGVLPEKVLKSGRVILNQYNIECLVMSNISKSIRNPIKRFVYRRVSKQLEKFEKSIYSKDNVILYTFVSTEDKAYFERTYGKENTYLIPVGAEVMYKKQEKGTHIISYISKLSYPANAEAVRWFVSNVWSCILEKIPDAQMYLVGKEPPEDIVQIGQEHSNVTVTGKVDSVEEYYEKSQLIVIPLLSGGGVKVKLLEALGYGKFVVTTSKGIEGTDVKDKEHVLVADDADDFAEACIDMLTHMDKYEAMRMRAVDLMEKSYSWDSILKKFEIILIGLKIR